ncbi:MAG: lysophospholipid acyltransferase family protein [Pseudomonadota bacterium]
MAIDIRSSLGRIAQTAAGAVLTGIAHAVAAPRVVRLCPPLGATPRIYIANHTSNADTVLIWACLSRRERRRVRPVAAADYWLKSPLRRFIGKGVFNAVLIERNPEDRTQDPVAQMTAAIDAGFSLILFPEGRRNEGEVPLLPLKSGIYHLARSRPDLEIVPVWIENLNGVLPRGEVIPVPLICTLTFGPPISPDLRGAEGEKARFLAGLAERMLALSPAGHDRSTPAVGDPPAPADPQGGAQP